MTRVSPNGRKAEYPTILINSVKVGTRHRKDLGDLDALAASMDEDGLLQPVGVHPDGRLIFGYRRLRAAQQLGWSDIPCHVIDTEYLARSEQKENELRKSLTLSERAAVARAVEEEFQKVERRGRPKEDKEDQANIPGICPEYNEDEKPPKGQETRDHFAKGQGFSSDRQRQRVNGVVDKGIDDLVRAMDEGAIPVSAAAEIAELPRAEQKKAVREATQEAAAGNGKAGGKRAPRSGAVTFDDRKVDQAISKLVNLVNERAKVKGEGGAYREVCAAQEAFVKAWKKWHKEKP